MFPKGNCPDGRPCATNVCVEPGCFRQRLDEIRAKRVVVPVGIGSGVKAADSLVLESMAQFREKTLP